MKRTIFVCAGAGAAIGALYAFSRRASAAPAPAPPLVGPMPTPVIPRPGGTMPTTPLPPPSTPRPGSTVPAAQPPRAAGKEFFAQLSKDPVTRSGQLYEAMKQRVDIRDVPSADVIVADDHGNTGVVTVSNDALKLYGVRINLDMYYLQQLCDHYGTLPMTQKIADEIWKQAKFQPAPSTHKISSSTEIMLWHSAAVDAKLLALGFNPEADYNSLIANAGKDWLLNSYYWLPGKNTQHCRARGMSGSVLNLKSSTNYGWFSKTSGGYRPSGTGLWLIQQAGNCHGYEHVDYSQVVRVIAGTMLVNGKEMSTAEVLVSPEYAGLLSYEGPLPAARHPGVPFAPAGILV